MGVIHLLKILYTVDHQQQVSVIYYKELRAYLNMEHFSSTGVQSLINQRIAEYTQLQDKFQKACKQVVLLNNQIEHANVRFIRASHTQDKVFMYMNKMKLMTLEGVRNSIYEYAAQMAEVIDEEQEKLVAMGIMEEEYEVMDTDWRIIM